MTAEIKKGIEWYETFHVISGRAVVSERVSQFVATSEVNMGVTVTNAVFWNVVPFSLAEF